MAGRFWPSSCWVAPDRVHRQSRLKSVSRHYYPRVIDPTDYLRIVLDPLRLAVLGAGALGPVDVEQLSAQLGRKPRQVLEAVGSLRAAGLLDDQLALDRTALLRISQLLPSVEPMADSVATGEWAPEEVAVLSRFFSGSRLTEIPGARGKRRVVLERLSQEFEPGVKYSEKEVNSRLQVFHADYASLRRYMVDEGLLTRAEGSYWRTGGRFPIDPE